MRSVCSLVVSIAFFLLNPPANGGVFEWKAPSNVKFPQAVSPVTGQDFGWRQEGNLWVLEQSRYGYLETPAWWTGNRPARGELVVQRPGHHQPLQ
jgi:hypothetical protein